MCSHYHENQKSVLLSEHNIPWENTAAENMYLSMREQVEDAALLLVNSISAGLMKSREMRAPSFDLHYETLVENLGEIKMLLKINIRTVGRILSNC